MFRSLAVTAAALALCGRAAGGEQDLRALLEGVESAGAPGIPGPLAIYGDAAFPVVAGRVGEDVYAPAIGALRAGLGRAVAFGKDGYLSAEGLATKDTGRLVCNAVRWAAGRDDPGEIKVAVLEVPGLDGYLTARGFRASAIPEGELVRALLRAHALCVNSHRLHEEDFEPIRNFLRAGGGVLVEGLGWGWLELNPGKDLASDHPANRLLAGLGIAWTDGYLDETVPGGFATGEAGTRPPLLTHAGRALSALAAPTGPRRLNERASAQAGWTLSAAITSLPAGEREFLTRVRRTFENCPPQPVPTREHPLRVEQGLARAQTALELKDLQALPPERVRAHPGAANFPGPVSRRARRVSKKVRLEAPWPGWHGTGLYAPPGGLITVKLPKRATGRGLKLRIGAHTDDLWGNLSWARFPRIASVLPLAARTVRAASPFGGLIYIEVPGDPDEVPKAPETVEVRISGAVEAPYYVRGRTSPKAWAKIRARPAPWAEIASDKIVLTVPSEKARALDDPAALMELWDRIMDAFAELAGRDPVRRRPERIVADIQISAGYMHAGYPIMTHLDGADFMLNMAELGKGSWGLFHELGHNHQADEWTFDGAGEVTCNLFTLYIYERICGQKLGVDERDHFKRYLPEEADRVFKKHLADGAEFAKWKDDPFLALLMYVQLKQAFGWEPFKRAFAEYLSLSPKKRPREDDDKRNQWMVRFSRAVGRDLGPFFEVWGVPVSRAARDSVAGLPVWLPEGMPAAGEAGKGGK